MGPSGPGDRPAISPRDCLPAEGGGSGLRSVPDRPPGSEVEDPAFSPPSNSTGGLDEVNARVRDPWRRGADRDTRPDVIDAAIAKLGAARAGVHRDEDDPPPSPAREGFPRPGAACASPSPCWPADWRARRPREGDPALPARIEAPGRGRQRTRVSEANRTRPADRRIRFVNDVILIDPDPWPLRRRLSSREFAGPALSPTAAGAVTSQ